MIKLWVMLISLEFPIKPIPKGRPRLSRHGVYTPQRTKTFENDLKYLAMTQIPRGFKPTEGAVSIDVVFNFKRPKSKAGPHACRPDLDNLLKSLTDALNGVLWVDDAQIISLTAIKQYADKDSIELHADI